MGGQIVVETVVAGRRDEEDARRVGCRDRVLQELGEGAATPARVDQPGAVVDGVLDGHGRGVGETGAGGIEELQGHEPSLPGRAHHAETVGGGGDDAPHVGTVAVVVLGVAVAIDPVVAVDVVHETVGVVVEPVGRDLAGVDPEVGGQVHMGRVDAGVDDGDDDAGIADRHVPRLGGVDVGIGDAAGLAGVVQAPLLGEIEVAGQQIGLQPEVGLGALHPRDSGEAVDRLPDREARGEADPVPAPQPSPLAAEQRFQSGAPEGDDARRQSEGVGTGTQANQHDAGLEGGVLGGLGADRLRAVRDDDGQMPCFHPLAGGRGGRGHQGGGEQQGGEGSGSGPSHCTVPLSVVTL